MLAHLGHFARFAPLEQIGLEPFEQLLEIGK
jgi:hypothetical protein